MNLDLPTLKHVYNAIRKYRLVYDQPANAEIYLLGAIESAEEKMKKEKSGVPSREEITKKLQDTLIFPETETKTFANLTNEQVLEICNLAYPWNMVWKVEYANMGWFITTDDIWIRIYPELSVEIIDIAEAGRPPVTPMNQYKIQELFRTWGIKPI